MKKLFLCLTLLILTNICFASEVSELLKKALDSYESGDIQTTIQTIDAAKKLIDSERIKNSENVYIEISNWDVVKLKKVFYLEKKVKFRTKYIGISGSEYLLLEGFGTTCTFNEDLVDTILALEKSQQYTFYGTVKEGWAAPFLHVEAIE